MKQVDLSTTAGSFGILANHVPTLATLRPGLLTVTDEEGVHKYFGEYQGCALRKISGSPPGSQAF